MKRYEIDGLEFYTPVLGHKLKKMKFRFDEDVISLFLLVLGLYLVGHLINYLF